MYSDQDLHKGGVSPFGNLRINDRSHLPAAYRSVPRPSSPLGAKASTERPSFTHHTTPARRTNTQHPPTQQTFTGPPHQRTPHVKTTRPIRRRFTPCNSLTNKPSSIVNEHEKPSPAPGCPRTKRSCLSKTTQHQWEQDNARSTNQATN